MPKQKSFRYLLLLLSCFILLCGCGSGTYGSSQNTSSENTEPRDNTPVVLTPSNDGTEVDGNDTVSIDSSNYSEGYVMVQYSGTSEKVKLQIMAPDMSTYTYNLTSGDAYAVFPLSRGDGDYQVSVLEGVQDDLYSQLFSTKIAVTLNDEFKPFLYPNQYCDFTENTEAVKKGQELSEGATSDLDVVQQVYTYVIENISYDDEKAETVEASYLPDVDETLSTGIGICFDYASLMSCMLRTQRIPTKLEVGYSGVAYHAWISVYLEDIGWVDDIIEFDGENWSLMDPTLAANNSKDSVKKYVGDGSNYTLKYSY